MLNTAAIMGRLTADPELRTTPNGVSVTNFTVAVDRSYTPKGQERQANFIDCVAWSGAAEVICKYFQKGKLIALTGSIQTRTYEDKNGNKRKVVEIVADKVSFCGDSRKPQEGQATRPAFKEPDVEPDEEDFQETLGDDLPF